MNDHNLPLVLLHRKPSFKPATFRFTPILKTRFQWFDPLNESESPVSALYSSVRIMLCVGNTLVDSQILDQYPALECIVCMPTGLDHVDLVECRRRRIKVTNAGDSFSDDVADYAVGLLIDVLRRVSAGDRFVRAGLWPTMGGYPLGLKLQLWSDQIAKRAIRNPSSLDHLSSNLAPAEENIEELDRARAEMAEQLSGYTSTIAKPKKEQGNLKTENIELRTDKSEVQEEKDQFVVDKEYMSSALAEQKGRMKNWEVAAREARARYEENESQLITAKSDIRRLERENETLGKEKKSLQNLLDRTSSYLRV